MCGLVFAHSFKGLAVNDAVWHQFQQQRQRGIDGFGVFDGTFIYKAMRQKKMRKWMRNRQNQSDMLLFHHRYPTSTVNTTDTAHPFSTGDYFGNVKYILAHNGKIDNAWDARTDHETEHKITYTTVQPDGTFNDSEALLWDIALTLEGKQDEMKTYGDISFICIKTVDNIPEKLCYGRNAARPLKAYRDKQCLFLSSTGEGSDVPTNELHTYHYGSQRLTTKVFPIPMYNIKKWESSYRPPVKSYSPSSNVCGYDPYDYDDDYYDRKYGTPHTPTYTQQPLDLYHDDDAVDGDSDMLSLDDDGPYSLKDLLPGEWFEKPSAADISNEKMRYLGKSNGNYDQAYWHVLADKSILNEDDTVAFITKSHQVRLLQAVQDSISEDKWFIDEKSLHPMWLSEEEQSALVRLGVE